MNRARGHIGAAAEGQAAAWDRPTYPRERVAGRIVEAAAYGIALIVAPAGYGKTEALKHTYDEDSARIVVLDERVSTVEAFFKRLIESAAPRHARGLAALLEKHEPGGALDAIVPWVAARLRPIESAIVVDDLHRVFRDPRAPGALRELIESTRSGVAWVLASRETPELPVGTWIARGWMHRPLTAADLAFRDDEAEALAALLGIAIAPADLAALVEDTGGWPIALQLALATRSGAAARVPAGLRTREVLFRYIDEQVWAGVEPEHRELLQLAAMLPQPSVAVLAAAGFPRAGLQLERLCRSISFILRDERGEFTLHDVFREFVLDRQRLDRERFDDAVGRVAAALAALGQSADALRLFAGLGAAEQILAILAESGFALIETGERAAVAAALAGLGAAHREHPVACGLRGHLQSLNGQFVSAEAELTRSLAGRPPEPFRSEVARRLAIFFVNRARFGDAVELLSELLGRAGRDGVRAPEVLADLAFAYGASGDPDRALATASAAADRLADAAPEQRAAMLNRLAATYFYCGDYAHTEVIGNEAAALATQLGLDGLAARAYTTLYAVASTIHQDTLQAEFYARAIGVAAENAGDRLLLGGSLIRRLVTAAHRGDDEAVAEIEAELARAGQMHVFRETIAGRFARALLEAGHGRFRAAARALETVDAKELTTAENAFRLAVALVCTVANGGGVMRRMRSSTGRCSSTPRRTRRAGATWLSHAPTAPSRSGWPDAGRWPADRSSSMHLRSTNRTASSSGRSPRCAA